MGRLPLDYAEKLRTRLYYACINIKTDLSEGKMDMEFCDPSFKRPYHERRRIFNRMKLGYMPYKGIRREEFIERVAQYKLLASTKDIYRSEFWTMLVQPYDHSKNNDLIVRCLNKLNLVSGKSISKASKIFLALLGKDESVDIDYLSFDVNNERLLDYQNALDYLLSDYSHHLDAITLVAALFRDSLQRGEIEKSRVLRLKYAGMWAMFFVFYEIDESLKWELINISKHNILNIVEVNTAKVIDQLKKQSEQNNDSLSYLLAHFFLLHEKL